MDDKKEQAERAANALLATERSRAIEGRNSRAIGLNPLFRVPELNEFEPWERRKILHEALRDSRRELPFVLSVCGFVLLIVFCANFPDTVGATAGFLPWLTLTFVIGLWALLRAAVRRHLRARTRGEGKNPE